MAFEVHQSETIYAGKVFNLRSDVIKDRRGHLRRYDIVEHEGAVAMVPIDAEDKVWFVRQYRPAVRRELLEIPAGTLEIGEDPAACAYRELREEIGMAAADMVPLGGFFLAPGYSSEYIHIYKAGSLSPSPLPQDEDEDIAIEKIPFREALRMLRAGEFDDAKTVAALSIIESRRR